MSNRTLVTLLMLALLVPVALPLAPAVEATPSGPGFTTYAGPEDIIRGVFVGFSGEPSVGVNWATGATFFQAGFNTFRVDFGADGASTWTDVSPPNTLFNVDPMLFTDAITGRTWAGGLDGMCSIMSFTDDDGATWVPAGNMCVPTLDHQTIASGPWGGAVQGEALYERAVYYCAQAQAVTCITSLDGGLTWGAPVPVTCRFVNPAFHGSLHVAPDGTVYLPFRNCGGGAGVSVSLDNGLTWTGRAVPGAHYNGDGFDPDVATTPSGWLYLGYSDGAKGASMVALSKDRGLTWSTPVDIGASVGVVTSTFHEVVAGDDERAAVAFLGTTTDGNAFQSGFAGVWDLYVATTYDGGATWATVKASTDPVQRGWICDGGTGCSSGRNLLDFMDAQLDERGNVVIAYADGCIGACAAPGGTAAQSTADRPTITRQTSGPTLFSAFDPQQGSLFASGHGPYTVVLGDSVTLTGAAANGVPPYSWSWSVLTRPAQSAADASSLAGASTPTPVFTPDVVGDYTLRVEVTDAAGDVAVDVVGVEAVGASGVPLPVCSETLALDAQGDSVATGAGAGRRDIVALRASDSAAEWTLCAEVADMADAPTTNTRFTVFWDAPYEAPGILYSATATVTPSGGLTGVQFFKGAVAVTSAALGGPAFASIHGDTLRISVMKPGIGGPADGEQATNVRLRIDTTTAPATTWDTAPDTGGTTFTFGAVVPDASAPTAVASLTASDPGTGTTLDLSWSAASDDVQLQDYVVRRSTIAGGPYRTIAVTNGLTLTDVGLQEGTTYHYVVAARDTAGNIGPLSPEASATPVGPGGGDTTPPTAPTLLAADTLTASWILLSWTASEDPETGIAAYRVYQDGLRVATTQDTSARVDGLAPATAYAFEVRAVNGAGLESAPAALFVTTPARNDCGQTSAPFELVADASGDATRPDGRADIVRVGVRETALQLWFHIGLDNRTASAPDTMVRVEWRTDSLHGFALLARVTDAGVQPAGMFLTTDAGGINLQRQPLVTTQCESVLVGVQKRDVLNPAPGDVLGQVRVTTAVDSTNPPAGQIYDGAPDTGGVDYVMGSAL